MKGVFITQAKIVNEDGRRKLIEIENGQIPIRNFKILEVKEDSYLGGHWHTYPECMYIMKGHVWDYKMKNLDTGEEEMYTLKEGDIVFRTGRIIHGGMFSKGCIVIDGASEPYVSRDFNDIPEDKLTIKNIIEAKKEYKKKTGRDFDDDLKKQEEMGAIVMGSMKDLSKVNKRKYMPTVAELIDRLSIVTLKSIKIPENKKEYEKEASAIMWDINTIINEKSSVNFDWGNFIRAAMMTMLTNEVIWQNESKAREGGSEQDKLLKFTHSVNGVRNLAKNVISNLLGERKDLKLDCLAADLCKERGYDFEIKW